MHSEGKFSGPRGRRDIPNKFSHHGMEERTVRPYRHRLSPLKSEGQAGNRVTARPPGLDDHRLFLVPCGSDGTGCKPSKQ
eukprot:517696-Hanusia_phi.AAC.1